MQSYTVITIIFVLFGRTIKAEDFSLVLSGTFPEIHDAEKVTSLCPCKDELLCVPLAEAMNKNSSAPHVLSYIKKSAKKEV